MSSYSNGSSDHRQNGEPLSAHAGSNGQRVRNDQHRLDALASLLADNSSLSDEGSLAVERAIPELRRGRPVVIRGASGAALLVVAAESAEPALLTQLLEQQDIRLILPAERLQHIGFSAERPQAISVAGWSEARLKEAVLAPTPTSLVPHLANVDIALPQAEAGLTLLKLAHLLPAALAVALPPMGVSSTLVALTTVDITGYQDRSAAALTIATRTPVPLSEAVDSEFVVFHGGDGERDQLAIVIGELDTAGPVPVRLHSACLTGDLFGSLKCDCGDQLRRAVQDISEFGGGIILYLDQEGRGIGLRSKMRAYSLQAAQHDTVDANTLLGYAPDERRYKVASRMLDLLGVTEVTLLTNNPEKIRALTSSGIDVVSTRRVHGQVNAHNWGYLATKAARSGHLLDALSLTKSDG